YDGRCSFFGGKPALPEGLGWFIILGLGTIFAILTSIMVWIGNRGMESESATSEHFTSAGRTITAGLTASDVVSKWTWAATLLQSSNVAFQYGVSGPFWYASGATIQIILFAILAIEIKRKCPAIHTILEIVLVRWGTAAHLTFLFFCLLTNLIVTAMLILGGSAVINALTGVNTYAACFIIPLSTVGYTAFGGLKGETLFYPAAIYAGPSDLGSTDKVWENLKAITLKNPITGNLHGSPLTIWSRGGLIFGIANIIGNFGTVFVDQSYWQGAVACKPSATWKGYMLGGMAWFAIPFSMATTLGLAARALDLPITMSEAGSGLVPPAVALHVMGQGGAFLIVLQLFLAVTSTANSEQLAVASLFAYDVYKRYFRPQASGTDIIFVSRVAVLGWGIFSGVIAIILFELEIGLGWVYVAMGNFIGSAVFPLAACLTWKDCSATGAICGAFAGLAAAMITWLVIADTYYGEVNVANMGSDYAFLGGNLMALFISPMFTKSYFGFWVAIAFIWGHVAAIITVIYPIWEVRQDIYDVLMGGKRHVPGTDTLFALLLSSSSFLSSSSSSPTLSSSSFLYSSNLVHGLTLNQINPSPKFRCTVSTSTLCTGQRSGRMCSPTTASRWERTGLSEAIADDAAAG
ncbi:hypothetical protein GUITHDRAFT_74268, partial [Guillardia theta CCMP2712]